MVNQCRKNKKCGFEIHYDEQREILEKCAYEVEHLRVWDKRHNCWHPGLQIWQVGVITCTNALLQLYETLQFLYAGIDYILTTRLNQGKHISILSFSRSIACGA